MFFVVSLPYLSWNFEEFVDNLGLFFSISIKNRKTGKNKHRTILQLQYALWRVSRKTNILITGKCKICFCRLWCASFGRMIHGYFFFAFWRVLNTQECLVCKSSAVDKDVNQKAIAVIDLLRFWLFVDSWLWCGVMYFYFWRQAPVIAIKSGIKVGETSFKLRTTLDGGS